MAMRRIGWTMTGIDISAMGVAACVAEDDSGFALSPCHQHRVRTFKDRGGGQQSRHDPGLAHEHGRQTKNNGDTFEPSNVSDFVPVKHLESICVVS